ncbi:hypothetical protein TNCV_4017041 [Trichonephila clavipes]|nr:hypothetical protein TNCV_4017041 [Trichonephila clavipes]
MVLKANDRRTSCPCHDEFRGPRSDYVRQEKVCCQAIAEEGIYMYLGVVVFPPWDRKYISLNTGFNPLKEESDMKLEF